MEIFQPTVNNSGLVVVTTYRGSWCYFCRAWLEEWTQVPNFFEDLQTNSGKWIIVSSQSQEETEENLDEWRITNDLIVPIGDPDNTIAAYLKTKNLLDVVVTGSPGPYVCVRFYPTGMVQSGCLIMKPGGPVLYRWRSQPTKINLQGAINRPLPSDVWRYILDPKSRTPRGKTLKYIFRILNRICPKV